MMLYMEIACFEHRFLPVLGYSKGREVMTAADKKSITVPYVKIVNNSRPKAVQIDLGESLPAWFPRHTITINKDEFTLTGQETFILEKLEEARGKGAKYRPNNSKMIPLVEPSQDDNPKWIAIDVVVKRAGSKRTAQERVFFPKSQIQDNAAPLWLVQRKEQEVINKVNKAKFYRNDDFAVTGLRADK